MDIFFKWTIGYVAEDRKEGSSTIEVICPKISPMVSDTGIDTNFSSLSIDSVPSIGGSDVSGDIDVANTVLAEYIGRSNMSIPDVVAGEMVEIAGILNGKFFWKEIGYNDNYRATEDLILQVANKDSSVVELTDQNTYRVRLNSTDKYISITTSKLDPDKVVYTMKMDVNNTNLVVMDDQGNSIKIDSLVPSIKLLNKSGSLIELNDKNININAPEDIAITAGRQLVVSSPATSIASDTIVTQGKDLSINASAATVIVSPTVGINGILNVTGGVASAIITGTAVSVGSAPPPMTPASIDTSSGSATPASGGASGGPVINPENEHASSFEKLLPILSGLLTCVGYLSEAIAANENAHAGAATAASPAVPQLLLDIANQITALTSAMPRIPMPNVAGPSTP